ncbi:uncharacterized protein LOC141509585 isoform X3 [Macrotis lagotis]|uniref:uncharacterized protein LOC141509585 isoform X3 n=1 Tax=Macrotis lagotis TaxID=92651 RepID=UPI003D696B66
MIIALIMGKRNVPQTLIGWCRKGVPEHPEGKDQWQHRKIRKPETHGSKGIEKPKRMEGGNQSGTEAKSLRNQRGREMTQKAQRRQRSGTLEKWVQTNSKLALLSSPGEKARMAARGTQSVSLERRNCALLLSPQMEKIKCLQAANANLKKLNEKLQEENDVLRSTEEVLLRDNDKIKKKILKLKERHETLQDDIYTLEERLCSCTCPENRSNHEHKESKRASNTGRRLP